MFKRKKKDDKEQFFTQRSLVVSAENRAFEAFDRSTFDSALKTLDIHRNYLYISDHSILDINTNNIKNYIGDINKKPTFGHRFKLLMHDAQISVERLSELSGIPSKSIQRMRNNETDRIKLANLVAVAIALNLPYQDSINLIQFAGYNLRDYIEIELIYDLFLKYSSQLSTSQSPNKIHNCNIILKRLGFPPLTKDE